MENIKTLDDIINNVKDNYNSTFPYKYNNCIRHDFESVLEKGAPDFYKTSTSTTNIRYLLLYIMDKKDDIIDFTVISTKDNVYITILNDTISFDKLLTLMWIHCNSKYLKSMKYKPNSTLLQYFYEENGI